MKRHKVRIGSVVYLLTADDTVAMHVPDILKNGTILMYREDGCKTLNIFGDEVGKKAAQMNVKVELTGENTQEMRSLAHDCLQKSKQKALSPEHLIPQLAVVKHRGKVIHRADENFYYIEDVTYCDNCKEEIAGFHKLDINKHGKVAGEYCFEPNSDEKVERKPNSKKWLHVKCSCTHVENEEHDNEQHRENLRVEIFTGNIVEQTTGFGLSSIVDMLIDYDNVPDAFARGAAYVFLRLQLDGKLK